MSPDKELVAMNDIVSSLNGLNEDERTRVINYIIVRYGISPTSQSTVPHIQKALDHIPAVQDNIVTQDTPLGVMDIRSLKEQKNPSSHVQMVVLLGYYLKICAPEDERKDAITATDVEKYFIQAGFPLPAGKNGAADTLNNARKAGYFESVGSGTFRLNPVGFNLAAYGMSGEQKSRKTVSKTRGLTVKKVSKKK